MGTASPLFFALLLGSSFAAAQGAPPFPSPMAPPAAPTVPPPAPPGPMMAPPSMAPMAPPWQPPPPVWQQPASPWTPQPAPGQGWGPSPVPPMQPPPPSVEGEAPPGMPLDLRGAIGLDTASFTDGGDAFSAVAIRVLASVPVARGTYLDVRLPLGFTTDKTTNAVLGNAILGMHGVIAVGKTTWLSIGGGLGLPLLSGGTQRENGFGGAQVPNAFWNIHEYMPSIVPLEARVGIEGEAGPVTIRGEIAPIITIPIANNNEIEVVILHAVEAQVGHTFAGGLRLQGVALPTFQHVYRGSFAEGDLYQAAMEPFFLVQQPRYFFRTGMMLPLDKTLGPPLVGSFGFRLGFGVRLE